MSRFSFCLEFPQVFAVVWFVIRIWRVGHRDKYSTGFSEVEERVWHDSRSLHLGRRWAVGRRIGVIVIVPGTHVGGLGGFLYGKGAMVSSTSFPVYDVDISLKLDVSAGVGSILDRETLCDIWGGGIVHGRGLTRRVKCGKENFRFIVSRLPMVASLLGCLIASHVVGSN